MTTAFLGIVGRATDITLAVLLLVRLVLAFRGSQTVLLHLRHRRIGLDENGLRSPSRFLLRMSFRQFSFRFRPTMKATLCGAPLTLSCHSLGRVIGCKYSSSTTAPVRALK
jgi:hypothetical protein